MTTHLLVSARHVLVAVILSLLAFPVFGQSAELFKVTSKVSEIAVAKQSAFLEKMSKNKYSKASYVITVSQLEKLQSKGIIKFSLPGIKERLTATTTKMEVTSSSDYTWWANVSIDGDSSAIGNLILIKEKGNVFGQVDIIGQTFEIRSDADGTTVMSELDRTQYSNEELSLPVQHTAPKTVSPMDLPESRQNQKSGRLDPCPEQMVVLALVTPRARAANANINQTILTALNQYNSSVYNSQISSNAASTVIIRDFNFQETLTQIPGQPIPIITDFDRLRNDPVAQQLRDNPQIRADAVVLITEGNYGQTSQALGVAWLDPVRNPIIPFAPSAFAYAVVEQNSAAANLTFAHELGHLFGGDHQTDGGPGNSAPYAHGYRFERTQAVVFVRRYSTLMHTLQSNRSRIQQFSNPNVTFDTRPTGTTDVENVARRMNETGPIVRTFRPGPSVLSGFIQGNSTLITGQNTFEAVYSCGTAPYTFQWATSPDGFTYGPTVSTAEIFNLFVYPGSATVRQIRLRVQSSDGQVITTFLNTNPPSGRISFEKEGNTNSSEIVLSDAFPNPATNHINFEFYLSEAQPVTFRVVNTAGQIVHVLISETLPPGRHTRDFSLEQLPAGLYSYSLATPKLMKTKRFVCTK